MTTENLLVGGGGGGGGLVAVIEEMYVRKVLKIKSNWNSLVGGGGGGVGSSQLGFEAPFVQQYGPNLTLKKDMRPSDRLTI